MPVQNGHYQITRITVHYKKNAGAPEESVEITNPEKYIAIAWDRTDRSEAGCTQLFSEYHQRGGEQGKVKDVEDKWEARDAKNNLPLLLLKDPECNSDPFYPA